MASRIGDSRARARPPVALVPEELEVDVGGVYHRGELPLRALADEAVRHDDMYHGRQREILTHRDKIKRLTLQRRKKENLRNAA